jgi:hypothetical protein
MEVPSGSLGATQAWKSSLPPVPSEPRTKERKPKPSRTFPTTAAPPASPKRTAVARSFQSRILESASAPMARTLRASPASTRAWAWARA